MYGSDLGIVGVDRDVGRSSGGLLVVDYGDVGGHNVGDIIADAAEVDSDGNVMMIMLVMAMSVMVTLMMVMLI